jgi:hypothetical protein
LPLHGSPLQITPFEIANTPNAGKVSSKAKNDTQVSERIKEISTMQTFAACERWLSKQLPSSFLSHSVQLWQIKYAEKEGNRYIKKETSVHLT